MHWLKQLKNHKLIVIGFWLTAVGWWIKKRLELESSPPECKIISQWNSGIKHINFAFLDLACNSVIAIFLFLVKNFVIRVKHKWFCKKLQEIVVIVKSWSRSGKNNLALVKPKSLFLALLLCSIQMEKITTVFFILFTSSILTL